MVNIYDLQKQGATIKVKPQGVLPVATNTLKFSPNMAGLTPQGATPPKKVVNINDLQKAGVPIKKVEPNFLQSVADYTIGGAKNIQNTAKANLRATGNTIRDNLLGGMSEENKYVPTYSENLNYEKNKVIQEDKFSKPVLGRNAEARDLSTGKGLKQFAGDVISTGASAATFLPIGKAASVLAGGGKAALGSAFKQGATLGFTGGVGDSLQKDMNLEDSIYNTVTQTAAGAILNPVALGAGNLIGRGLTNTIPKYARNAIPNQFKTAVENSQANLDKVLDNISIPNNTPNSKTRDTIEYVRKQFPNLQEEVAIRSGKPIETINENGRIKFQTANQAETILQKAYSESQNAGQIAKNFDTTTSVSNDLLKSKLDSVLSQTNTTNVAGIREKALKILDQEAQLSPTGLKPSKVDDLRSKAGLESNKYDTDGNLVGDADVYSVLSKVYKEALFDTIKEPNYQTFLRNSADNFELARLLKTLHNKEAFTPRTGIAGAVSKTGSALDYVGNKVNLFGVNPLGMAGDFLKYLPERNSAEQKLRSNYIEELVKRAGQVGAKITDGEQRVLNFVKRREQTNKTGQPIEVNIDDINALKNLEGVKKTEEAVKLFNKRFGEDVLVYDDNFGIDLAKYYDRMQGATSKQKADITAELYKEILQGNKASTKTVLPSNKIDTSVPMLNALPKGENGKMSGFISVGSEYDATKFTNMKSVTTKILSKLEGRETVSKQFISDLTNSGDVKQVEKDLIRSVLADEGDKVNVADFTNKVQAELLPLKVKNTARYSDNPAHSKMPRYEQISLPDNLKGDVKNYNERIYESPINTSAGSVHFGKDTNNYFGHTRIEDMADDKTRRVIEVQSDLFQKGNLEKETDTWSVLKGDENVNKIGNAEHDRRLAIRKTEVKKLQQYGNGTAHFRMAREEIKKAAEDGKTILQFPTGETAMKIEGLGNETLWAYPKDTNRRVMPDELKTGMEIVENRVGNTIGDNWIVTDVLGDGKFKAVQKSNLSFTNLEKFKAGETFTDSAKKHIDDASETFDISGKTDTSNPIYKFYDKELANYLKNNYKGTRVTDAKGVNWIEIPIEKGMANQPVSAFSLSPLMLGAGGTAAGAGGLKGLVEYEKTKKSKN